MKKASKKKGKKKPPSKADTAWQRRMKEANNPELLHQQKQNEMDYFQRIIINGFINRKKSQLIETILMEFIKAEVEEDFYPSLMNTVARLKHKLEQSKGKKILVEGDLGSMYLKPEDLEVIESTIKEVQEKGIKAIVEYFEIKSPFLTKVGTIKAPIYQDENSKYFAAKDGITFYAMDNELSILTNLRDWITNLKCYTNAPEGLKFNVNWMDTIKDFIPENVIDIPELNIYINELLNLIIEEDKILLSILSEVEDHTNIHHLFSQYNKTRIITHFNFNYKTETKFWFNDVVIGRIAAYNLKTKYFELWRLILVNTKSQLENIGYDLYKSPFWQIIINPKMDDLRKLCLHDEIVFSGKAKIAADLIGFPKYHTNGNKYHDYNQSDTKQPVFHYINDVLIEYNLSPNDAREIVLQMKGAFSPEWNKNVIPFIVQHLELIKPTDQQVASIGQVKDLLEFSVSELGPIVLKIARMSGNENPSFYLDKLLDAAKSLGHQNTFLENLYGLIKINANSFWSEGHRKNIQQWLSANSGNMIFPSLQDLWNSPSQTGTKYEKPAPEINAAKKRNQKTLKENLKNAIDYLQFLSGANPNNEKIMTDENFKILTNYVQHTIEFDELPRQIRQLPQTNISNGHIRYTFWLINRIMNGRKVNQLWITFLHKVFKQFKNESAKTTKTNSLINLNHTKAILSL